MRVVPRIGYAYSSRMQETASWDIFYAHGHPDEICQHALTGARRSEQGKVFPTRLHTGNPQ